jgi:hypothetical protein
LRFCRTATVYQTVFTIMTSLVLLNLLIAIMNTACTPRSTRWIRVLTAQPPR